MKKIENYIHGKITSNSKKELSVSDPSTGEVTAKVVLSGVDDFSNVIQSAKKSQVEWIFQEVCKFQKEE